MTIQYQTPRRSLDLAPTGAAVHRWTGLRLILVAAISLELQSSTLVAGGLTGDLAALREAADLHEANRDSIRTWQCHAEMIDTCTIGMAGETQTIKRFQMEFYFDRESQAKRYGVRLVADAFIQQGAKTEVPLARQLVVNNGLLKDGAYYLFTVVAPPDAAQAAAARAKREARLAKSPVKGRPPREAVRRNSLAIKEPDAFDVSILTEGTFDPFYYFGHSADLAASLRWYADNAENPKMTGDWIAHREENLVVMEGNDPTGHDRRVINMPRGAELSRYESTYQAEVCYSTRRNIEVAGIWVPEEMVYEYRRSPGDVYKREIRFFDHVLNEPIPAGTFEFAALGVKDGDRVQDFRTNDVWSYQESDAPRRGATSSATTPAETTPETGDRPGQGQRPVGDQRSSDTATTPRADKTAHTITRGGTAIAPPAARPAASTEAPQASRPVVYLLGGTAAVLIGLAVVLFRSSDSRKKGGPS